MGEVLGLVRRERLDDGLESASYLVDIIDIQELYGGVPVELLTLVALSGELVSDCIDEGTSVVDMQIFDWGESVRAHKGGS